MIQTVLDPDRPPCPWCARMFSMREAKWYQKHPYCPHCRMLVGKFLSHTRTGAGDEGNGWYWGKPNLNPGQ